MGVNPELPGVNMYMTTCLHGVDLRFTPRCYLCKPWPDDSPVWKVASPGHVHDGEWCALCVEHGVVEEVRRNDPLDVERLARAIREAYIGGSRDGDAWDIRAAAIAREYAKEPQP